MPVLFRVILLLMLALGVSRSASAQVLFRLSVSGTSLMELKDVAAEATGKLNHGRRLFDAEIDRLVALDKNPNALPLFLQRREFGSAIAVRPDNQRLMVASYMQAFDRKDALQLIEHEQKRADSDKFRKVPREIRNGVFELRSSWSAASLEIQNDRIVQSEPRELMQFGEFRSLSNGALWESYYDVFSKIEPPALVQPANMVPRLHMDVFIDAIDRQIRTRMLEQAVGYAAGALSEPDETETRDQVTQRWLRMLGTKMLMLIGSAGESAVFDGQLNREDGTGNGSFVLKFDRAALPPDWNKSASVPSRLRTFCSQSNADVFHICFKLPDEPDGRVSNSADGILNPINLIIDEARRLGQLDLCLIAFPNDDGDSPSFALVQQTRDPDNTAVLIRALLGSKTSEEISRGFQRCFTSGQHVWVVFGPEDPAAQVETAVAQFEAAEASQFPRYIANTESSVSDILPLTSAVRDLIGNRNSGFDAAANLLQAMSLPQSIRSVNSENADNSESAEDRGRFRLTLTSSSDSVTCSIWGESDFIRLPVAMFAQWRADQRAARSNN